MLYPTSESQKNPLIITYGEFKHKFLDLVNETPTAEV